MHMLQITVQTLSFSSILQGEKSKTEKY